MSSIKSACHICNRSYKNVLEHITKSHSWMSICVHKNGDIVHRDTGAWAEEGQDTVEMFWQDKHFRACEASYDTETGDITYIMTCKDWDGEVQVSLRRLLPDTDLWRVDSLTTFVASEVFPGGKPTNYIGKHIQVLHKRV